MKSDLLSNKKLPRKFDLILANLPYLPSSDLMSSRAQRGDLESEIASAEDTGLAMTGLKYEPHLALDGGHEGLDLIKKLIIELPDRMAEDGLAILEIDPRQKTSIAKLAKKFDLEIEFQKDLNNRTRLATISKKTTIISC